MSDPKVRNSLQKVLFLSLYDVIGVINQHIVCRWMTTENGTEVKILPFTFFLDISHLTLDFVRSLEIPAKSNLKGEIPKKKKVNSKIFNFMLFSVVIHRRTV